MYLKSVVATALTLFLVTAATASRISLGAGDYGDLSLACDNELSAAVVSFEGMAGTGVFLHVVHEVVGTQCSIKASGCTLQRRIAAAKAADDRTGAGKQRFS